MTTQFNWGDCFVFYSDNGVQMIRCPDCKLHGENIDTRGDCKNLIKKPDGTIMQCQCWSKAHK